MVKAKQIILFRSKWFYLGLFCRYFCCERLYFAVNFWYACLFFKRCFANFAFIKLLFTAFFSTRQRTRWVEFCRFYRFYRTKNMDEILTRELFSIYCIFPQIHEPWIYKGYKTRKLTESIQKRDLNSLSVHLIFWCMMLVVYKIGFENRLVDA